MTFALLIAGVLLLVTGAELLVRGAARLARAAGLSSLVIGLTVVAFGTSAPELAVSLKAVLVGQSDLSLGNIVGSNIFNILFILGLSALIRPLRAATHLVRLDVPVMIAVAVLTWPMACNGLIGRTEGILLVVALGVYTTLLIGLGKAKAATVSDPPAENTVVIRRRVPFGPPIAMTIAGLALLMLGSDWLVQGAVKIARLLGASELTIGLTIIAAGTSLPELVTSLVAAIRNERDIAIGNVVGSNIFNVLGVLGFSAALAPAAMTASAQTIRLDLPVMIASSFLCLPVFITGAAISRLEGGLFLLAYAAYAVTLLMLSLS